MASTLSLSGQQASSGESLPYHRPVLRTRLSPRSNSTRPGDRQFVAGLFQVWQRGQSHIQVGDNTNLFYWTYVGNVVYAHLLAADKLGPATPADIQRVATRFWGHGSERKPTVVCMGHEHTGDWQSVFRKYSVSV